MRLTYQEAEAIKQSFLDVYESGELYLFGSRLDDDQKGGDIDLYLCPESRDNSLESKLKFLVEVKQKIGDQKIDVIVAKNPERFIEKEASSTGVLL